MSNVRESPLEARQKVRILGHDVTVRSDGDLLADHATLTLRLSTGDQIQLSVNPDSIGNVYTSVRWARAGTRGTWEKIVTCLNDGVFELIGRGRRHQT